MITLLKQLFCNHTNQRCLTKFDTEYVNKLYNNNKKTKYTIWKCERCGKLIKKKIKENPATMEWIHIRIKSEESK